MTSTILWWLSVQILALAALPLALRWLRWLPDRGYFFAKPLGILLVSYLLWLGASLGIVDNTPATIALLTIGLGVACWLRYGAAVGSYWQSRRRFIIGTELLFAGAFALWALVRAYNPEIAATEKPMEIAFLSATIRSVEFPPLDPWLAGNSISYYYFGYVAMGMLAKLAGVGAPVAFNLSLALLFAMTFSGAFALGYNLVARARLESGKMAGIGASACGLLASFLVTISSNLEGVLELLNARGSLSPGFSRWLQIKDLPAPYVAPTWLPGDNWWWFRAARVIGDIDPVTKASRDYTINEFPFFSFVLGDLHPHVLALPFAVLAIAAALNLLYSGEEWSSALLSRRHLDWLMLGLVFGGLGFLNSWDMPAYLLLLGATLVVQRYVRSRGGLDRALLGDTAKFLGLALLASIVLYLPFYIGFRTQASGLGLVGVRTKLHHFAIFWGPLFFLAVSWFVVQLRAPAGATPGSRRTGAQTRVPAAAQRFIPWPAGPRGSAIVIGVALVVVVLALLKAEVAALLLVLLVVGCATLWRHLKRQVEAPEQPAAGHDFHRPSAGAGDQSGNFVWLLTLVAMLLIFICEWLFIKDFFNNRMNTVFKLYYQGWLMLAVAGAYVLYYLAIRGGKAASRVSVDAGRFVWQGAAVVVLAASLVYPIGATIAKTESFSRPPTLDGQAFLARSQPDDDESIRWLRANVQGAPIILEATGGSYSAAARVSSFTGLPTLLGWDFHEQQWRGSYEEQGRRKADIEAIYSGDRATAENLLRKYWVTYVYVGPLERETYGRSGPAALAKFDAFMDVVHEHKSVKIYRVRG